MAAKAVYSLASLKMGAAGVNGVMGTTLLDLSKIAAGSVTFNFPAATITNITPENEDYPFVSLSDRQPLGFSFKSLDLSLDAFAIAFGGTVVGGKWTPGVQYDIPAQSIALKTRRLQGTSHLWEIPLCTVSASITGSLTKTDVLTIDFTDVFNQPYDVAGVALPVYTITQAA